MLINENGIIDISDYLTVEKPYANYLTLYLLISYATTSIFETNKVLN